MPPESVRLRAQLSEHLEDLNQLEVIEAAEGIVRRRLLHLLRTELAGLRDDLADARRHLVIAREIGDRRGEGAIYLRATCAKGPGPRNLIHCGASANDDG